MAVSTRVRRARSWPYPRATKPARWGLPENLVRQLAAWINARGVGPDDLMFATREGTSISRNTFRSRSGSPAIQASGFDFDVRFH